MSDYVPACDPLGFVSPSDRLGGNATRAGRLPPAGRSDAGKALIRSIIGRCPPELP